MPEPQNVAEIAASFNAQLQRAKVSLGQAKSELWLRQFAWLLAETLHYIITSTMPHTHKHTHTSAASCLPLPDVVPPSAAAK